MRPPESVIQRGFSGGELAPVLHARADHERFVTGLRTCKNFLVQRHGAVSNRPGFRFVAACKTTSANVRLQRYLSETPDQSILVEVGSSYLRFFKNGAPLVATAATAWSNATNYVVGDQASSGGVNYSCILAHINHAPPNVTYWVPQTGAGGIIEVATPYTTAGLIGSWEQSGNIVVITHRLHDPRELVCYSENNWVLRLATTIPVLAAPTVLGFTVGVAGTGTVAYVVTAANDETFEESPISNVATSAVVGIPTEAAPNVLTWTPPAGTIAEYYVYKDIGGNGVFGLIGTAKGAASFRDTGSVIPDFDVTPPNGRTPFVSALTRPHVATHYQQRRFYAQSIAAPEGIEGSRTGFPNNFTRSSPLQDDDGLTFRIVGRQYHPVRHILGLKRLTVFTAAGVWSVGQPNQPLTPNGLGADQETYAGAAPDVVPVVVGNSAIYLQAQRSIIRDLQFEQQVEGLNGRDLTLFASHLFDGHQITRMDYAETPHSIVWAVRDDGVLLGLTYVREQNVWGWHQHTTDGLFEQVCTVPEGTEDVVYVITRRTIGGVAKRYIEKLESRDIIVFDQDVFFVDSGLSYSGAPATVFSGLTHLEGERVSIVSDGSVISNGWNGTVYTVTGGSVTIPSAGSNVHIGLPIQFGDFETLDLDAQGTAIRDKEKRVGSVTLLLDKSSRSFWAGPDVDNLTQNVVGLVDEAASDEYTGQVELSITADWSKPGRVMIRQIDPLPLTILGILPNLIPGG